MVVRSSNLVDGLTTRQLMIIKRQTCWPT